MFHPGERDTVGRFSELASLYDSYRPDYPATAIDFIMERAGLQRGMRLIDIGCGTGISSRQFAERGLEVIGIEPNSQMRQIAESLGVVTYRGGTAEATGMPDTSADAVLVAQAFHWFPTESALRELLRILKPGGWVALIWNDRDDADPFTAGFDSLMRVHSPDPELSALRQSETGMVLLHSQLFDCGERFEFPQQQSLTVEQLLGRANSVSFAPREPLAKQRFETALRELHARFASNGIAALRYRTALFLARKPLVPNRTECYAK